MIAPRLITTLPFLLSCVLSLATPCFGATELKPSYLPFNFQYLFTTHVDFGPPSSNVPIPIPGGVRIVVNITGGSVTGPVANGTITSGTAYSQFYNNQIYGTPKIALFGELSDSRLPFFVQEEGVDTEATHTTRIFLDVAGEQYRFLREGYILAHVTMAADQSSLDAECYLVLDA